MTPASPPASTPEVGPTASPPPLEDPTAIGSRLALYLCPQGPDPVYRFPAPVYSATYADPVEGFDPVGKLRGRACDEATPVARAPVSLSDAEGGGPTQRELETWGYLSERPGLWVLVRLGEPPRLEGWVELYSLPPLQLMRGESMEEALDLPLLVPGPARPGGLPDLTFGTPKPVVRQGEVCTVDEYIPPLYRVTVRNDGGGTSPVGIQLALEGQGPGEGDIEGSDWMRGLEPGEELELAPLSPGTHLRLDPRGRIRESNEGNNELTLDPLPQLICG